MGCVRFALCSTLGIVRAELWLRQHQFVQVDSLCSQMLVNSMEDIKFAMKILSMRCLLSWQLDW